MPYNLLVSHRTSRPCGPRFDIAGAMESLGEWIEIRESVFVLWTSASGQEVHDRLRRTVGNSDVLTVLDLDERRHGGCGPCASPAH